MDIGTLAPILISLASLYVAIRANSISRKNAKDQQRLSREQQLLEKRTHTLEERGLAAEHLKKYEHLISDSYYTVRAARKDLGLVAGKCLRDIGSCFNPYDYGQKEYTRHVFYKIYVLTFTSMRNKLASESGVNLHGTNIRIQLNNLTRFSLESLPSKDLYQFKELQTGMADRLKSTFFKRTSSGDLPDLMELVQESPEMAELILEFSKRLPSEKLDEIYQSCIEQLRPYFELSKKVRPIFQEQFSKLKKEYESNQKFGEIKIDESSTLKRQFKREIARADQLNALHVDELEGQATWRNPDAIQTLIYVGTVLHALESHEEWGGTHMLQAW